MKTSAAVLFEINKLEVVDLEIPKLKPGQVLVEVLYSGVCGTQIGEIRGLRGQDQYLPHCLGHEGSGIVREISEGVTNVKVDQKVVLSWIKDTGANVNSTTYTRYGDKYGKVINAGGVTTFQKHTVVSENRLTKLLDTDPLPEAALLGCPIPTGMGSLIHTADIKCGSSVIVFGAGGVGCCVVTAAKRYGCKSIVVVDPVIWKLDIARKLGATGIRQSCNSDFIQFFDYAIETSGNPQAFYNAMESVKPQGGIVVIVGNYKSGTEFKINPSWFNQGKQLRGTFGGDSKPRDFLGVLKNRDMNLNLMTNDRYSLTNINKAVEDLENSKVIRPLIDMSL